jgi:molybdopterin synthase sulfur carrier subunit
VARVLYFAQLVEKLGLSSEDLALPAEVTTVRGLLAHLRARGPQWERYLAEEAVRVMVNRQLVNLDAALPAQAEIAIVSTRPG